MGQDDDDRRRASGNSWTSWFQPTDNRRLEQARLRDTRNDLDQRIEQWIQEQDADALTNYHEGFSSRKAERMQQSRREPFETNPFVAFKSFVDDQIAAITQLSARRQERHRSQLELPHEDEEVEADKLRRWTGRTDVSEWLPTSRSIFAELLSSQLPSERYEHVEAKTYMLLEESIKRNSFVPSAKLAALFHDPETDLPIIPTARDARHAWQETDQSTSDKLGMPVLKWLSIDWFRHSPYSPVNLERHPELSQFDTKWRHAFENLLEATLDKPMTNEERFGLRGLGGHATSTWHGPGVDWMLSLQCRGILPPQLPSWYKPHHLHAGSWGIPYGQFSHRLSELKAQSDGTCQDPDLAALAAHVALPPPDVADNAGTTTELDMYEQNASCDQACPDEIGRAVQEAMSQEHKAQEPVYPGVCPDNIGAAIQEAVRQEEDDAELDAQLAALDKEMSARLPKGPVIQDYQMQLYLLEHETRRIGLIRAAEQKERERGLVGCPDELGREVQMAAMQDDDDDNDGDDDDFEDEDEDLLPELKNMSLHDHQMDLIRLEQQNKSRLLDARAQQDTERELTICPDALRKEILLACSEGDDPALQDYKMQLLLLELQNIKWRIRRARAQQDSECESAVCPDELGRKVQMAGRRDYSCPDSIAWIVSAMAHRRGCSVDEELDKIWALAQAEVQCESNAAAGDEDDDDFMPGELWSVARQERERRKSEFFAARSKLRAWSTKDREPLPRPSHEAMARHWDRLEPEHNNSHTSMPADDEEKPVSTSMTTLTTRSPDGNVVTKVVRNVRYADGREENSESVQTSRSEQAESKVPVEQKPKRGWFWS